MANSSADTLLDIIDTPVQEPEVSLEARPEFKLLRYSFAKKNRVLITEQTDTTVTLAYLATTKPGAIHAIRHSLAKNLQLKLISDEEFNALLVRTYETKTGAASQLAENIGERMDLNQLMHDLPNTADLLESENDAPVISLLNALFSEAVKHNASDIHLETFEEKMTVRFRIDGLLKPVLELPPLLGPLVVSRIKVMSRLNIAEKRLPQDGRITIRIAGATVDVRVSTIPANHGERVVLRLLNKKASQLRLDDLGMHAHILPHIKNMIAIPHGIILVTGPTGSGKTTSLYAMLTALNVPGRNILTVEDPIEYDLSGIGQIQVNPKVEMSFARGLRAILRQDPNVIMVGEIRDQETAQIAVQASLTGHLVLSTLHTNTAAGAVVRLRDMGIEPFLLSSSLIGVIAQRLVRLLCTYCKMLQPITPEEAKFLNLDQQNLPKIGKVENGIYHAVGCEQCGYTGYSGRKGIYEIMVLDTQLKTMIHDNENETTMEEYARTHYPSIRQDGILRILAGDTTIDEVLRVTSA